ncbi:pyridoxamine 5'-phosphate oxidase family protein [Arenibacter sp. 6A1]|uniref:pyridoxamine 5'-phosphate oxidase family protein n=1 Tax=Arenibacter sp. 6A1 TaxID=2720391 RepID=UPI0014455131|nr:pyridoxamine 5'-phosphate oxidase family protein [Arenibacter sp. 6A1]NKI26332.1 pyridoxamine 5'-phosphate oxidase family protein [Arenibacter sp. 6A1]
MTSHFFEQIKDELQKGPTEANHPFRYFTFATVGLDQVARLRTVVLRKVSKDLTLTFFTDKRSKKITHIKENKKVSLLFYNPAKMLQLKIEGIATYKDDEGTKAQFWSTITPAAKKAYTTSMAPGSALTNPQNLEFLNDENHFCTVEIIPFKMEYLQLAQPNHIRVRFSRTETHWEGEFIVP